MTENYCVNIEGDRTFFKSKNAIKRFKSDIKKSKDNNFNLDANKYFKEGISYTSELNDYSISIKIINKSNKNKLNNKNENRRKLREKLRTMRGIRSSHVHHQAKNMKKKIPKNVLKSYMDLNRTFDVPVPKPDEVLSDPDKYSELIKAYASRLSLTEDPKMNRMLNKYFKSLAKSLNLDVEDGEFNAQQIKDLLDSKNSNQVVEEDDNKTDSEEDTEEENEKLN
jgi:hypothetical protein